MRVKIAKRNKSILWFKVFSPTKDGSLLIFVPFLLIFIFNVPKKWRVKGYMKRKLRRMKFVIKHYVLLQPIYLETFQRDCDCVEVTRYVKVANGWRLKRYYNDMDVEGVYYDSVVSKQEYLNGSTSYRDRVMESYENGGNGYYV